MLQIIINYIKKILGIHSPSKMFYADPHEVKAAMMRELEND